MALSSQFVLAPSPQVYFVDKNTGAPLAGGFVYCYSDNDRSTLKPAWTLIGGVGSYDYAALPNPIPLSSVGTCTDGVGNDIIPYWFPYDGDGVVENYYLVIKDAQGNTQETRQAWPNFVSSTPTVSNYAYNYVRNSCFSSWSNTNLYTNIKTGSNSQYDFVVDDWTYQQQDPTQNTDIFQFKYTAGDNSVPTNSPYCLEYKCNTTGSGQSTYNRFQQYFKSVETLQNQTVSVEIWLRSNTVTAFSGTMGISYTQYFGTGGLPATDNTKPILTITNVPTTWTKFTGTATIDPTSGKNRGTNNNDAFILNIDMPLGVTCDIQIGSIRLELGNGISGTQIISNDSAQAQTNFWALYPPFSTGDVKMTIKNAADPGWLMMDDGTIGNPSSNADHQGFSNFNLYSLLWTNVHNLYYTPMYDSSGNIVTSFGASAKEDWDANHQLSLTRSLGRVLAGVGAAEYFDTFTATATTGTDPTKDPGYIALNTTPTNNFLTGTAVTFSVQGAGTLPTGLSPSTTYYLYQNAANKFYIYDTRAHAIDASTAGGPVYASTSPGVITLTTAGSGTLFINVTMSSTVLGQFDGERAHSQLISELVSHNHNGSGTIASGAEASTNFAVPWGASTLTDISHTTFNMPNTGGDAPFNIVQPTTYMNVMIKL